MLLVPRLLWLIPLLGLCALPESSLALAEEELGDDLFTERNEVKNTETDFLSTIFETATPQIDRDNLNLERKNNTIKSDTIENKNTDSNENYLEINTESEDYASIDNFDTIEDYQGFESGHNETGDYFENYENLETAETNSSSFSVKEMLEGKLNETDEGLKVFNVIRNWIKESQESPKSEQDEIDLHSAKREESKEIDFKNVPLNGYIENAQIFETTEEAEDYETTTIFIENTDAAVFEESRVQENAPISENIAEGKKHENTISEERITKENVATTTFEKSFAVKTLETTTISENTIEEEEHQKTTSVSGESFAEESIEATTISKESLAIETLETTTFSKNAIEEEEHQITTPVSIFEESMVQENAPISENIFEGEKYENTDERITEENVATTTSKESFAVKSLETTTTSENTIGEEEHQKTTSVAEESFTEENIETTTISEESLAVETSETTTISENAIEEEERQKTTSVSGKSFAEENVEISTISENAAEKMEPQKPTIIPEETVKPIAISEESISQENEKTTTVLEESFIQETTAMPQKIITGENQNTLLVPEKIITEENVAPTTISGYILEEQDREETTTISRTEQPDISDKDILSAIEKFETDVEKVIKDFQEEVDEIVMESTTTPQIKKLLTSSNFVQSFKLKLETTPFINDKENSQTNGFVLSNNKENEKNEDATTEQVPEEKDETVAESSNVQDKINLAYINENENSSAEEATTTGKYSISEKEIDKLKNEGWEVVDYEDLLQEETSQETDESTSTTILATNAEPEVPEIEESVEVTEITSEDVAKAANITEEVAKEEDAKNITKHPEETKGSQQSKEETAEEAIVDHPEEKDSQKSGEETTDILKSESISEQLYEEEQQHLEDEVTPTQQLEDETTEEDESISHHPEEKDPQTSQEETTDIVKTESITEQFYKEKLQHLEDEVTLTQKPKEETTISLLEKEMTEAPKEDSIEFEEENQTQMAKNEDNEVPIEDIAEETSTTATEENAKNITEHPEETKESQQSESEGSSTQQLEEETAQETESIAHHPKEKDPQRSEEETTDESFTEQLYEEELQHLEDEVTSTQKPKEETTISLVQKETTEAPKEENIEVSLEEENQTQTAKNEVNEVPIEDIVEEISTTGQKEIAETIAIEYPEESVINVEEETTTKVGEDKNTESSAEEEITEVSTEVERAEEITKNAPGAEIPETSNEVIPETYLEDIIEKGNLVGANEASLKERNVKKNEDTENPATNQISIDEETTNAIFEAPEELSKGQIPKDALTMSSQNIEDDSEAATQNIQPSEDEEPTTTEYIQFFKDTNRLSKNLKTLSAESFLALPKPPTQTKDETTTPRKESHVQAASSIVEKMTNFSTEQAIKSIPEEIKIEGLNEEDEEIVEELEKEILMDNIEEDILEEEIEKLVLDKVEKEEETSNSKRSEVEGTKDEGGTKLQKKGETVDNANTVSTVSVEKKIEQTKKVVTEKNPTTIITNLDKTTTLASKETLTTLLKNEDNEKIADNEGGNILQDETTEPTSSNNSNDYEEELQLVEHAIEEAAHDLPANQIEEQTSKVEGSTTIKVNGSSKATTYEKTAHDLPANQIEEQTSKVEESTGIKVNESNNDITNEEAAHDLPANQIEEKTSTVKESTTIKENESNKDITNEEAAYDLPTNQIGEQTSNVEESTTIKENESNKDITNGETTTTKDIVSIKTEVETITTFISPYDILVTGISTEETPASTTTESYGVFNFFRNIYGIVRGSTTTEKEEIEIVTTKSKEITTTEKDEITMPVNVVLTGKEDTELLVKSEDGMTTTPILIAEYINEKSTFSSIENEDITTKNNEEVINDLKATTIAEFITNHASTATIGGEEKPVIDFEDENYKDEESKHDQEKEKIIEIVKNAVTEEIKISEEDGMDYSLSDSVDSLADLLHSIEGNNGDSNVEQEASLADLLHSNEMNKGDSNVEEEAFVTTSSSQENKVKIGKNEDYIQSTKETDAEQNVETKVDPQPIISYIENEGSKSTTNENKDDISEKKISSNIQSITSSIKSKDELKSTTNGIEDNLSETKISANLESTTSSINNNDDEFVKNAENEEDRKNDEEKIHKNIHKSENKINPEEQAENDNDNVKKINKNIHKSRNKIDWEEQAENDDDHEEKINKNLHNKDFEEEQTENDDNAEEMHQLENSNNDFKVEETKNTEDISKFESTDAPKREYHEDDDYDVISKLIESFDVMSTNTVEDDELTSDDINKLHEDLEDLGNAQQNFENDVEEIEEILKTKKIHNPNKEGGSNKIIGSIYNDYGEACLNLNLSARINLNNTIVIVPPNAIVKGNCSNSEVHVKISWKSISNKNANNSIYFVMKVEGTHYFISYVHLNLIDQKNKGKQQHEMLDLQALSSDGKAVNQSENISFKDKDVTLELIDANLKVQEYFGSLGESVTLAYGNAFIIQIASGCICVVIVLIVLGFYMYKKTRSKERIFNVNEK